jgi:hypothetical protein
VVSETPSTAIDDTTTATIPAINEILADWRLGRNQDKREEQRAAGRVVLEWLRDQEVASAAKCHEVIEPDHPVADQSPSTWWEKTSMKR